MHLLTADKPHLFGAIYRSFSCKSGTLKLIRVMKLTAFFLLIGCLQLSARADGQEVTLKVEDVPLRVVFREIQKQTGLNVMVDEKLLKKTGRVSINVSHTPVVEVLNMSLRNEPLVYTISNGRIVIKAKEAREVNAPIIVVVEEEPTGIKVSGRIVNEKGEPVVATVQVKGNKNKGTTTNEQGYFTLEDVEENAVLLVSGVSIESFEIKVSGRTELGAFTAQTKVQEGDMVVVNTGYQRIPRERITGSFVQVDEKLINRRVSTNLLDRLEDVTSGVLFNKGAGSEAEPITIRGRSTIFSNTEPLIVIDNLPYDGSIDNINPNDVESISILRDAAAASIWGARAGNGVIVITTKKGLSNSKPSISFNTNFTFGESPDLYYVPQMEMGDFIEIEKALFAAGVYRNNERSLSRTKLSPVVETLIKQRDGLISADQANTLIESYKLNDIRRDLDRYYYRNSLNQQHALNLRGGSNNHRYVVNAGFDRNLLTSVGAFTERFTLGTQNSWSLINNKLELSAGFYLAQNKNYSDTKRPQAEPYERLSDDDGNPLRVLRGYSERYINSIANDGLLDWTYVPLQERGLEISDDRSFDLRTTASARYQFMPGLSAEMIYQYWQNNGKSRTYNPLATYFTRDYINRYTQVNPDGTLYRPVPEGGILSLDNSTARSHSFRAQVNYSKQFGDHTISALGGYEAKDNQGDANSVTYFGYDDELGLSQPVDFISRFRLYYNPGIQTAINPGTRHKGTIDRFISYFGNIAYAYKQRYFLTLSARKDQSNLFGVDANMRGVPLWSAGLGWNINSESFYQLEWLPLLKIRATYGYSGNVNKTLSAYTTAYFYASPNYDIIPGLLRGGIYNPPNPALRWEKIQSINLGLDFELKNRVLSGTVEWFSKKGMDLIGTAPVPASTGAITFTGNFASTLTSGLDLTLNSNNLSGAFEWQTKFLYSYINEKILSYETRSNAANYMSSSVSGSRSASIYPLEGRPLFSVYSYAFAGLDPQTGDPLGYLNGDPSKDYNAIINAATPDNIVFHGPVRPKHFGAIRNDFSWKGFSLSVNVSFRLGNYFRRRSIDYFSLLRGSIQHGDYTNRWQQPGDEQWTNIPSMPALTSSATVSSRRNNFYRNSSSLVEKGDHIRLQDIRLSYQITSQQIKWLPVKSVEFYGYANNLGIIWKATKLDIDPFSISSRPLRSIALGCKIDF